MKNLELLKQNYGVRICLFVLAMMLSAQMLAAEVEQLKAYRDVDSMSLLHHAELLENSTIDNSALESKLVAEIGNLARELG